MGDVLWSKELGIRLVLQIVNRADGRNTRFVIGWRGKRAKQQVDVQVAQQRSSAASLQFCIHPVADAAENSTDSARNERADARCKSLEARLNPIYLCRIEDYSALHIWPIQG